jgi:hypothetical protein
VLALCRSFYRSVEKHQTHDRRENHGDAAGQRIFIGSRSETEAIITGYCRGVLIVLSGFVLALSAGMKFAGVPAVVHQMAVAGFGGGKLTLIASLETACSALFLWPRARSLGLLLVSSYLGGAICTHIQAGEYGHAFQPALILSLAWIGAWLRHPQMLWSVNQTVS